ncbi:thioesterase II family protein [Nocardioides speluncae]|uniref:thioesterase II family protein n=1 Tax=Nocardioides speluncae TaxID=2670337 RepID=UPI000D69FFB1|nr:alpha/beta fold hydrolase [Nocardioides speluncae]
MTDLFCLPFAGAGSTIFRPLASALGERVRVRPVALPGRGSRFGEPPEFTLAGVAAEVAEQVDGPYALYGHSMGARLAYELCHLLPRLGVRPPAGLAVGAAGPPDVTDPLVERYRSDPDAVLEGLREIGGMDDGVLDHPELAELLLPILHADLAWLRDQPRTARPALDLPLLVVLGQRDRSAGPWRGAGWSRMTTGSMRLRLVDDDHFFVHRPGGGLAGALMEFLAPHATAPVPDLPLVRVDPAGLCEVYGDLAVTVEPLDPAGVQPAADLTRFAASEAAELRAMAEPDRTWHAARLLSARRAARTVAGQGTPDFSGQAGEPTWRARGPGYEDVAVWHIPVSDTVVAVARHGSGPLALDIRRRENSRV